MSIRRERAGRSDAGVPMKRLDAPWRSPESSGPRLRRRAGRLVVGAAVAVGAAAGVAPAAPAALTPVGPATVSSSWRGASTGDWRPQEVLQAVKITVGPGGAAGMVRLRASDRSKDPERGVVVGDWTWLPAEPGTYTIPAPRVDMDSRSLVLGLDQQTGGHEIVEQHPCAPENGPMADMCQILSLDAWTPILPDSVSAAPPEFRLGGPPPT